MEVIILFFTACYPIQGLRGAQCRDLLIEGIARKRVAEECSLRVVMTK